MDIKPKKICFVGGPSTGKTTLAKYLAEELTKKNHPSELVGEFVRDYLVRHGPIKSPEEQLDIIRGQKEKEKMACSRNYEFVVCDAASFLSHVYFHFLNDGIIDKKEAEILKRIEEKLWQEISGEINSYDFVFFLPQEFPPEEDGVRLFTDKVEEISDRIKAFLNAHNIKYHELRGTVQERADKAFKVILN
ncbi:MAG: ATP-binding protein [Candidatus Nealsonbacteria bacterium]|nr:ATP-binding protein [Candidatus Nealsonbacteria bacterium]